MALKNHERRSPSAKERDLFLAALEQPTLQQRVDYLDRACGGDLALRAAVESLLQNNKDDNFLKTPVVVAPPSPAANSNNASNVMAVTEQAGDRIGRYQLLQEIGEGGCG